MHIPPPPAPRRPRPPSPGRPGGACAPPPSGAWSLLVVLALLTLNGCGAAGPGPALPTAATGQVEGQLTDAAGVTGLVFRDDLGATVTVTPAADGRFAAALAPGHWQLLAATASGGLRLVQHEISVEAGATVTVLDARLVPSPRVVSVSVPVVTDRTAAIAWDTDIDSDGQVDYGIDTRYGISVAAPDELSRHHRVQLSDLAPATTYHFRITASRHHLESVETYSQDHTFTTRP